MIGIDVGISKLIATSDEQAIGKDWRQISARVRRRRPGSKGKRRARIARDHSINHAVKQLPWPRLSAIGFEDLNGLKRGKSQGKNFRIAAAPWTYRRVRQRIECLALENRVLPVAVDPRGTSRTCPACGKDDRRNRKGEVFRWIACDHKGDADFIGARNISTKTLVALGRVLWPRGKKCPCVNKMLPDRQLDIKPAVGCSGKPRAKPPASVTHCCFGYNVRKDESRCAAGYGDGEAA